MNPPLGPDQVDSPAPPDLYDIGTVSMVHRVSRAAAIVAAALVVGSPLSGQLRVSPIGDRPDAAALELLLRKLSSSGTFMQTDAHPDDEDNALLALLGEGQGMRTTLVTATRGDGGQNEIGPELSQALGVLRTEELLAVHDDRRGPYATTRPRLDDARWPSGLRPSVHG